MNSTSSTDEANENALIQNIRALDSARVEQQALEDELVALSARLAKKKVEVAGLLSAVKTTLKL